MEPKKSAKADDASPAPVTVSTQGDPSPSAGSRTDETIAALRRQVAELTEQVKKLTELAARSQADLQNAKMRMARDAEELRLFASELLIKRLVPVIDNFQRAFQHLPEDLKQHEWVKGVGAIEADLLKQLTELGLKKIDAKGQRVNPMFHEVLMTGPGEEGMVLEVFEDGWELHGKVIRPAKVKVGIGPVTE